jgi:serralysin
MRSKWFALIPLLIPLFAPSPAAATFHLWQITELYSNADGSVQFVELFTNANFQDEMAGHTLASTGTTFTYPPDLDPDGSGNGNDITGNHYMLIATPAFASQPGAVPPDFTFAAANFMSKVADTINFAGGFDTFTFTSDELPTNGVDSLNEPFGSNARTTAANSPTNFHGQVGSLPEPSAPLGMLAGAAAVFLLARRRLR